MQLRLIQDERESFAGKKILIPLSGGINSAAALLYIGESWPDNEKPDELHLYYAHFQEHSPDTFRFVKDQIRYARMQFSKVFVVITRHSALRFFQAQKMIPHPTLSPCSVDLKIIPMMNYASLQKLDYQIIGYVRGEAKRIKRQQSKGDKRSIYPIRQWSDEDCFSFVRSVLGWYPAIYDIRERGKRVFTHNNCLPCKNMSKPQLVKVEKYYPGKMEKANALAESIGSYWGRDVKPNDPLVCNNCERLFS